MGSIEGVIVLSSTNEPILNSHFVHPLTNYPSLHTDQLVAKLEAASGQQADVLPVVFTEGIPAVHEESVENEDGKEEDEEDTEEDRVSVGATSSKVRLDGKAAGNSGAALVHIGHNRLRFVATFSTRGGSFLISFSL